MASPVEFAGPLRALVLRVRAEKGQRRVVPDRIEGVEEDVSQQKIVFAEKKVTRINRAIGHDAEFCGACRAPDP